MCQGDSFPLTVHDLTACLYYKLALDRGLRGCTPELEHELHLALDSCPSGSYIAGSQSASLEMQRVEVDTCLDCAIR